MHLAPMSQARNTFKMALAHLHDFILKFDMQKYFTSVKLCLSLNCMLSFQPSTCYITWFEPSMPGLNLKPHTLHLRLPNFIIHGKNVFWPDCQVSGLDVV